MGIKASSNRIQLIKKSASTSSLSTAPTTPTSPLDIEVEHLETLILVWLDRQIDDDEQNEALKKRLRQYVTYLVTFDDLKSCEQWLKNRSNNEKILFIVPSELEKRIVPNIHQLTSIVGIYVFCWKPEVHQIWTQHYSKVRGVISKAEGLIQQISKDQNYFENIELSKSIQIVKNHPHTCIVDPENTSFIWYQLFLEILTSSSYFPSVASSAELIQILRRHNSNDQEGLNLIKEFEQNYDKQKAARWLTNNTPLARFLNKALREQNISMLFYLRFFLIDISNQLTNHQLQSTDLYRKQIMTQTDIENIRANINNYLIVNDFLHTSTQLSELSMIETNDNQFQTVFMEIHAEHRDETAPFALVEKDTDTDDDQNGSSVIFMCGSKFKIISLEKNKNSSWILRLSLAGNKDLNILFDKKQKLRTNKNLLIIVDLLDQCNQSNKANLYCQHLLRELPPNHRLVPKINEKINSNAKVQPVSLDRVQIILIDLSTRLNPLASAMLNALRLLTNDSILIRDNSSNIDFDTMLHKTILLFASSQAYTTMTKKPTQITQCFILEEDENNRDQPGRFTNSEDLIFQLADELYRCYKWEAKDDSRAGQTTTANEKEELANQIHKEMKRVHRQLSEEDNQNKPPISTTTTIVYLKLIGNNNNGWTKVQDLLRNVVSSFSIFDDREDCFNHVLSTDYYNSVFLIIDNDYQDVSVIGFHQLKNIKKIYRYDQSSSPEAATNNKRDHFCVRLIHDLISHYNQLANECEERNDSNNAKDMFLKARQLCEVLIQLCKK